jgi:tRNA A-37 threonylcarbamoyl transferase component Bud32/tetratricopeptide (TPR) repeat protein
VSDTTHDETPEKTGEVGLTHTTMPDSHTHATLPIGPRAAQPGRPEVEAGRRIGRYVVLRKLGEGGMGEVYAAYDEELDRRVAVKVLHPQLSASGTNRARMQREAQAMARLSHPHVVQVYDVGTIDGQLFLAMEFVRGQTLREWQATRDAATEAGRDELLHAYIDAGSGLAAAHEAGLVHRDFKPDNVIIGEDGRARVLDFGLVGAVDDDERASETSVPSPGPSALSNELTRPGAMMGTPLYMAPEQFRGAPTDQRTDQFNFCASLYHALYKQLAFAGDNVHTLMTSVCEGRLQPISSGVAIPEWLRAVLVRGLSHDPDARFSSMHELLAALRRDRSKERRRRRKTAGVVLAIVLVSVGSVLGSVKVWQRWTLERRETQAFERLSVLEARLDGHGIVGQEAREFVDGFASQPDNWGTVAAARAWLHQAKRETDEHEAIAAYAQAYVRANDEDTRNATLLAIAAHLEAIERWSALAGTLELLSESAPASDEFLRLRVASDMARRDFGAARARLSLWRSGRELDPLLAELGRATATNLHDADTETLIPADFDGDGRAELVTWRKFGPTKILASTPTLELITELPFESYVLPRGAAPPLLLGQSQLSDGLNYEPRLLSFAQGRAVEQFRWQDHRVTAAVGGDLDGDGVSELFVGTGPYTRHLLELVEEQGRWSTHSPSALVDRLASDVLQLEIADLDDDGRNEMLVALGPWSAWELRVLRRDDDGKLASVDRKRLGYIRDLTVLDHLRNERGGLELMVPVLDEFELPPGFAFDFADQQLPGLFGLQLQGDELALTRFIPTRNDRTDAGDLDGDGSDELILGQIGPEVDSAGEHEWRTTIYVLQQDGTAQSVTLMRCRPVGVYDLDGDGDDELLVYNEVDKRVWTLGTGDDHMPVLETVSIGAEQPGFDDPTLAAMWQRAEQLYAMRVGDEIAAETFEALALQTDDEQIAITALLRGGSAFEQRGDDQRAAEAYERGARFLQHPSAELTSAATHALLRRGDLQAALERLERDMAKFASPPPVLDDLRTELLHALAPERRHELRFDRPVGDAWQVLDGLGVRRDPIGNNLNFATMGSRPLLSRPARWDGGLLVFEVDFELDLVDWNAAFGIGLRNADDRIIAGLDVGVRGGSADLDTFLTCIIDNLLESHVVALPTETSTRVTVRLVIDRQRETETCSVTTAAGERIHYFHRKHTRFELPQELQLELWAQHLDEPNAWVSGKLHRITLAGVELPALERPDTGLAARLAEGDWVSALAEFPPEELPPPQRVWRISALLSLGRLEQAKAELRALSEDEARWTEVMPLLYPLLRTEPVLMGGLLQGVLEPIPRMQMFVDAWKISFMLGGHPTAVRVLHAVLSELEQNPTVDLLSLRARVHEHIGLDARALDDLEAAVALLGESESADALRLRAASRAAGQHPARARALVEALLAGPRGEAYRELIADDDQLAYLLDGN